MVSQVDRWTTSSAFYTAWYKWHIISTFIFKNQHKTLLLIQDGPFHNPISHVKPDWRKRLAQHHQQIMWWVWMEILRKWQYNWHRGIKGMVRKWWCIKISLSLFKCTFHKWSLWIYLLLMLPKFGSASVFIIVNQERNGFCVCFFFFLTGHWILHKSSTAVLYPHSCLFF